jgi:tetratricopeptide (TPR) repeat protein
LLGQPATPMFGLGGVGKTEIAAEYCHRYAKEYTVVWWVRAEQEDTLKNSLIALGRRMGLPDFHSQERDYSAQMVLDALRAGAPYDRWLLVFDNATRPEVAAKYIPQGSGHVIVTSRISEWGRTLRSEGIEVNEFSLDETVDFLRQRVDSLRYSDDPAEESLRQEGTTRLARAMDNLPLAAEHAAAFLVETGTPVDQYLEQFATNAHELLGKDVDIYYPHAVATTWSVSRGTLSPEADALFQLLAFFSPEPISEELLVQPGRVHNLPESLKTVLGDLQEFRRAGRELARFSLIKVFGIRNVVQMHRVVQAVTRGRLEQEDPETVDELRATVHTLLAASDPGSPEYEQGDPIYERSRHHLIPSGALESADTLVRALVINQVRRMHRRGGYDESLSLGEAALRTWREKFGPDDLQTLWVAVEVTKSLIRKGRFSEAQSLIEDTLRRLRDNYGEDNDVSLQAARAYAICLRMLGHYAEAYEYDMLLLPLYERHLRPDHLDTLNLRNNLAIDLRCLGRFEEALEMDRVSLAARERNLGPIHVDTLVSKFAVARDLRRLGRYDECLDMLREITSVAEEKNEPWHVGRLLIDLDMVVALRRSGYYQDARGQGEAVLIRHTNVLGAEHRQTLTVAINLINDRRLTDDLEAAQELGEQTLISWEKIAGVDHPNTLATVANLAIVLRTRGNSQGAKELDERALEGMSRRLGEDHPHALVIATNLASDFAALGEVREARQLGERTLEMSTQVMGESHPCTLATAANLALDRRAVGDETEARELFKRTLAQCEATLTRDHPRTRLIAQRGRVPLDIEPMMT